MTQIKLNPLTDLGLNDNTQMQSQSTSSQVSTEDLGTISSNNTQSYSQNEPVTFENSTVPFNTTDFTTPPLEQTVNTVSKSIQKSPFEGISEMNNMPQSNIQTQNSIPPYTVVEPQKPVEPKKTESLGSEKNNISSLLLISAVVLFVVSLGALMFFALMYFKII